MARPCADEKRGKALWAHEATEPWSGERKAVFTSSAEGTQWELPLRLLRPSALILTGATTHDIFTR